jgi:hypothetical protein
MLGERPRRNRQSAAPPSRSRRRQPLMVAGPRDAGSTKLRPAAGFRSASPMEMLQRKEWTLMRRDPGCLLPPAFLVWRSFESGSASVVLLVPVMAAGQLTGGLAWLAISGEGRTGPDMACRAQALHRRVRGNSPSRPYDSGMTVVDRPTISGQFLGRFRAHFRAVPARGAPEGAFEREGWARRVVLPALGQVHGFTSTARAGPDAPYASALRSTAANPDVGRAVSSFSMIPVQRRSRACVQRYTRRCAASA